MAHERTWDIAKTDGFAPQFCSIIIASTMCERTKTVNAIPTENDGVLPWLWIIIFYSGLCALRLISLFWLWLLSVNRNGCFPIT